MITLIRRIYGLRKWRHLTSVLLRRLHISSLFRIYIDDIVLLFQPTAITINLWEDTTKYKFDRDFLRRAIHEGDVCVDAGANVGLLTLIASKMVGTDGTVYAVEAHPRTYMYLKENLEINMAHNVVAYNTALGATIGTITFSDEVGDDLNHVVPAGKGLTVPLTTLDTLSKDLKEINLLKIDVEGYELEVLKGAARTLSVTQCIYFESFDTQLQSYNSSSKDLIKELKKNSFTVFFPPGNDDVLRIVPETHSSPVVENLLAVRDIGCFIERTGYKFDV